MIATLPMYDWPQSRPAYDALWVLIRDGLRARGLTAPDSLDHAAHFMEAWGRDDLVLSHICNLPLRARYTGRVTVIGTSDYALPDTPPGHYHSVWLVRAEDPAAGPEDCASYRYAFNDALSQSGWGAPLADARARGLTLCPHLETGAHRASLAAVAAGEADLACIDAVTWSMVERWEPVAPALRPIGRTASSPGMTFITGKDRDPAPMFDAVAEAIAALPAGHRAATGLRGIVRLPEADYAIPLPDAPRTAAAHA